MDQNRIYFILLAAVLVFSMLLVGFASGSWFAASFVVEPGSGLAGGAEVAFGGIIGAVAFIVASVFMIRSFDLKKMLFAAIVSLGALAMIVSIILMQN